MILQGNGAALLGPKQAGETRVATFNFADELAAGAAIQSASVVATWIGGTYDASPAAVLNGAATISGATVLQSLTGGLAGAVYKLVATATDDVPEVHTIEAQLVVDQSLQAGAVPWSTLVPWVLEHAKECPGFLIERHLVHAARRFCEQSHAWRSDRITLLTTEAGVRLYQGPLQANAEIHKIHEAWRGMTELTIELPGQQQTVSPAEAASASWSIGVQQGSLLRLTPAPLTAGQVVQGTVSYIPAWWAVGIPEPIYRRWGHEIAHGAAADLTAQANKPWTDPKASSWLERSMTAAAARASFEAGPVYAPRQGMRVVPCR